MKKEDLNAINEIVKKNNENNNYVNVDGEKLGGNTDAASNCVDKQKQPIEYDNDGMIEMLNQLYFEMKDDIESYAQEYWYECLNEMDEDDMPEDLEEEFTEWWDNEDTSMIEEDLCQMASELLSEIEGKEVECDDLDEYFQVLDKLGEEVGFAYNFGYLRNILDYGVDLYNDCEIILEN